jgi:hypothetical protein
VGIGGYRTWRERRMRTIPAPPGAPVESVG